MNTLTFHGSFKKKRHEKSTLNSGYTIKILIFYGGSKNNRR